MICKLLCEIILYMHIVSCVTEHVCMCMCMCMCMCACICMLVFEYVCVPVTCLHAANQPVGSELFLLDLILPFDQG